MFGLAGYRFMIPTSVLLEDPQTARFAKNSGELQLWGTEDNKMILYACRDGKLMNCATVVVDETSGHKKGIHPVSVSIAGVVANTEQSGLRRP